MNPELSIIIVNYNGIKFLEDCFSSIANKMSGIDYEIIVVDNSSADASSDFIRVHYPQIHLIASQVNLGFGKGNNKGVEMAIGNYILLLNNDTILLDDIHPILNFLKSDKNIGLIGINMLNAEKRYLPAAGNFPNFFNMLVLKKLLAKGSEFKTGIFSQDSYDVDWLGGSFLLLRKDLYLDIGGFDENYFMYVEDVDLSKKIANKGLRRVFLPKYNYIHFVGFNKSKNPLLIKGYEYYISKHHKGLERLFLSAALKINKTVKKIKSGL